MMQAMAKSMTRTESVEFSSGPRGGWGGGHGGKMGYNQISTSIKPLIQDVTWAPGVTRSGAGPSGDVTKTAWIIAGAGPLGWSQWGARRRLQAELCLQQVILVLVSEAGH